MRTVMITYTANSTNDKVPQAEEPIVGGDLPAPLRLEAVGHQRHRDPRRACGQRVRRGVTHQQGTVDGVSQVLGEAQDPADRIP